jgi:hypothetical protein
VVAKAEFAQSYSAQAKTGLSLINARMGNRPLLQRYARPVPVC